MGYFNTKVGMVSDMFQEISVHCVRFDDWMFLSCYSHTFAFCGIEFHLPFIGPVTKRVEVCLKDFSVLR